MLRRFLGYLKPDKQILLIPYQEGMLVFEGRPARQRLTPEAARLIEYLARHVGELVTHEDCANVIWPGGWPDDWHNCVARRVHEARQILPTGFISTEREGHKAIGFRLAQEIVIEQFERT